jgi:hypothetical protein
VVLASLGAGCSAIAGVDFGAVHARDDSAEAGVDGGPLDDDGALLEGAIQPGTQGCAADEKKCSGSCVKTSDPLVGCGSAACDACSLPYSSSAVCKNGACAPGACAPGYADCDGDPKNGCEADLTNPATCHSCTLKCAPTEVCAPNGCAATCPAPTKLCGASCVDTTGSPAHCGNCTTACPVLPNADPVCTNSKCGISCHAGFGDCDNNPTNGCEPLGTFYQDADNDGYGGPNVQRACIPPLGYKTVGGDCDDADARVFPGQPAYFTTSYTSPAGAVSFDYDCSGTETEDPAGGYVHFTTCGVACDQEGYLTAIPFRSGPGVDNFCGSTRYETCVSTVAPLIGGCSRQPSGAAAIACK